MAIEYNDYATNYALNREDLIPKAHFSALLGEATAFLTMYSMGKITEETGGERFYPCLFEVAELFYRERKRRGVKEETTDGYRVLYDEKSAAERASEIVTRYYGASGLLYRGMAPC